MDWANASTWVAIGTLLAVVVALAVYVSEIRERRRRQAMTISSWIDHEAGAVHVRNGGEQPATHVMLALFTVPGHYIDTVSGHTDDPWVYDLEWIGPGHSLERYPHPVEWYAHLFPPELRMEFTDAAGRRWLRDERGRLRRIRHSSALSADWRSVWFWFWHKRRTARARSRYTRWRWPDV